MLEWSNVISPATLLALGLAAVGFGGWIFKLGSQARDIHNHGVEQLRIKKELEQFEIAVNAAHIEMKALHAEFREEVAKTYSTKQELADTERRTNVGMDRIVQRLEQISGRLETIGDAIIKTLATR